MNTKGLIHVYTGTGKGKTTAAIGLCTRALGHELKVCYVSFHKQPEKYGYNEMQSLKKLGARVINLAKGHPHMDKTIVTEPIERETHEGIIAIMELMKKENFDILVLDEILISVRDSFLEEEKLIEFIKDKPADLELILTGRDATPGVIELADYVSEINKIKHPYDSGVLSRIGIEY